MTEHVHNARGTVFGRAFLNHTQQCDRCEERFEIATRYPTAAGRIDHLCLSCHEDNIAEAARVDEVNDD